MAWLTIATDQARRILKRLGFVAARAHRAGSGDRAADRERPDSAQAEAFRPYVGQWVALAGPTDVLVAADSPQEVLAWLSRNERKASYGMFRVPASISEAEGTTSA